MAELGWECRHFLLLWQEAPRRWLKEERVGFDFPYRGKVLTFRYRGIESITDRVAACHTMTGKHNGGVRCWLVTFSPVCRRQRKQEMGQGTGAPQKPERNVLGTSANTCSFMCCKPLAVLFLLFVCVFVLDVGEVGRVLTCMCQSSSFESNGCPFYQSCVYRV